MKRLEKDRVQKVLVFSFVIFSLMNGLGFLSTTESHLAEFIKGLSCGAILVCTLLLFKIKRLENRQN